MKEAFSFTYHAFPPFIFSFLRGKRKRTQDKSSVKNPSNILFLRFGGVMNVKTKLFYFGSK